MQRVLDMELFVKGCCEHFILVLWKLNERKLVLEATNYTENTAAHVPELNQEEIGEKLGMQCLFGLWSSLTMAPAEYKLCQAVLMF